MLAGIKNDVELSNLGEASVHPNLFFIMKFLTDLIIMFRDPLKEHFIQSKKGQGIVKDVYPLIESEMKLFIGLSRTLIMQYNVQAQHSVMGMGDRVP